jgi:MoaA/NifB/PqqE/SkfB family radical SAM enzyme
METLPGLSVVVPSYRSARLPEVLARLAALGAAEVLVADSSPEAPQGLPPGVTLVRSERRLNPGAARNLGARRAKGPLLLFVDSDVVLTEAALGFVRGWAKSPSSGPVSGVYEPAASGGVFSRIQDRVLRRRILGGAPGAVLFSSSHFLVTKADFERVGGFNEELRTYEDVEFSARAAQLGLTASVSAELAGTHLKPYAFWGLVADYAGKAHNAFRTKRRYPGVFRGVPFHTGAGLAASWLAGACLLPAAAAAGAAAGAPAGALAAALLFLAPLPLLRGVLRGEPAGTLAAALVLWPCVGTAVAAAVLASAASWYAGRALKGAVFLADLARGAWRALTRDGFPVQVIAYVTARCNLRCEHCFYKETLDAPDPGELSLKTFERTTRGIGPVLWFSLGGGEPFIRPDLGQVIDVIQANCRPKVFSFPTNGWYTEKTFETTLRLLQRMDGGNLILFFSLDGPRDMHDEIRGPGSFERVKATMERLRPLTRMYPNLYLNVVTTVTERNASVATAFIDELIGDFQPSAISINLFRYHSLKHPPLPAALLEGYRSASSLYSKRLQEGALRHYGFFGGRVMLFKEILQKDLIYRVAKFDEYVTPCTAGTLSYVIMEDGRLLACEILPDVIGNVKDADVDFSALVTSKAAGDLRRRIYETDCKCTYECAMSTNTLFSWPMSFRLGGALARDLTGLPQRPSHVDADAKS